MIVNFYDSFVCFIYIAALGVTYNEKEEDYAFMFKSINEFFKSSEQNIEPKFVMCDAAHAIGNAFMNTFASSEKVLMCWAHMSASIYKKKYNQKENKDLIKRDINTLQKSPSEEIFMKGIELFNHKWSQKEKEFIQYFNDEWVNKNPNWFGGASLAVPNTNNCLESFNNSMKNHQTLRKRMSFVELKSAILDIVKQRSLEYKGNHKIFNNETQIKDNMWIDGYNLSKAKQVKVKKFRLFTKYYMSAKDKNTITEDDIANATNLNWNTFNDFEENVFSIWQIIIFKDVDWKLGTCTCPIFQKEFICKHIIVCCSHQN